MPQTYLLTYLHTYLYALLYCFSLSEVPSRSPLPSSNLSFPEVQEVRRPYLRDTSRPKRPKSQSRGITVGTHTGRLVGTTEVLQRMSHATRAGLPCKQTYKYLLHPDTDCPILRVGPDSPWPQPEFASMLQVPTNLQTMRGKRAEKKDARTRIYRALYGDGSNTHNVPWTDSRKRPENWSLEGTLDVLRHNWRTAQFDDFRIRIVLFDINELCKSRGHGECTIRNGEFFA